MVRSVLVNGAMLFVKNSGASDSTLPMDHCSSRLLPCDDVHGRLLPHRFRTDFPLFRISSLTHLPLHIVFGSQQSMTAARDTDDMGGRTVGNLWRMVPILTFLIAACKFIFTSYVDW